MYQSVRLKRNALSAYVPQSQQIWAKTGMDTELDPIPMNLNYNFQSNYNGVGNESTNNDFITNSLNKSSNGNIPVSAESIDPQMNDVEVDKLVNLIQNKVKENSLKSQNKNKKSATHSTNNNAKNVSKKQSYTSSPSISPRKLNPGLVRNVMPEINSKLTAPNKLISSNKNAVILTDSSKQHLLKRHNATSPTSDIEFNLQSSLNGYNSTDVCTPPSLSIANSSLYTPSPNSSSLSIQSNISSNAESINNVNQFAIWKQQEECRRTCYKRFRKISSQIHDKNLNVSLNGISTFKELLKNVTNPKDADIIEGNDLSLIRPNPINNQNTDNSSILGFLSVFEDETDNSLLNSSIFCLDRSITILISSLNSQYVNEQQISSKAISASSVQSLNDSSNFSVQNLSIVTSIAMQSLITIQGLLLLNYDSKLAFSDKKLFSYMFKFIRDILINANLPTDTQYVNQNNLSSDDISKIISNFKRICILMIEVMEACIIDCSYANRKFESTNVLNKIREVLQCDILKVSNNERKNTYFVQYIGGEKIKKKVLELIKMYLIPENEYPDWSENGRSSINHKSKRVLKVFNQNVTDSLLKDAIKTSQDLKMGNNAIL